MLADVGIWLAVALAVYIGYETGKATMAIDLEDREDAAADLAAELHDPRRMIEECILHARQVTTCASCGYSPLPCCVEGMFVSPETGENVSVLSAICPECATVNTGRMNQHLTAMISAVFEWDRASLRRDILELESADGLTLERED